MALPGRSVPLAGQKRAWRAGDHPRQGASGLALCASLKQANAGVVPGQKSIASLLGSPQGVSLPFSAAFSPCLTPMSAAQRHGALRSRAQPGDACTPLLVLQSASLEPCHEPGQGGDHSPPAGSCRGASPACPLLPEGGRDCGCIPALLFPDDSAASGFQKPSVSGTGVPLSVVGNNCLASWEGGKGAQALPGERSCPPQTETGPETLLLLPSQAPLSACHQNLIPSASPAVFGHSSLPPVKEQLVVAAYVSVCRVREGGE